MKKIMFALGAIGMSVAAVAAVNDSLLMFSTKGPDTYRDGSTVLDGECYALCYVTDPGSFAIKSDGTAAAGGEVLLTSPVAKDGHCPNLMYVVPAEKAESLTGGSYAVYLLDTRVPDANAPSGYSVAGMSADGKTAAVVNGAGSVADVGSIGSGTSGFATYSATTVGSVAVAAVIDRPAITAIKVDGANIVLTVAGLSPAADYKVYTGAGPAGVSKKVEAEASGNTFTVSKDAGQFFKVIGTRKVAQ